MSKKLKLKPEINLKSRILASGILLTYLAALNPVPLFAKNSVCQSEDCNEVLISAQEGGKIELDGASIEIPSGALKKDTKISITHLRRVEDTGESLYNAIPSSGGYRFLPHGTKFLKDVTITLPYSPELNGKPQALEDLYTYFYDEKNHRWIKLERLEVNQKECVVRSLSSHFTDMINATLTLPESASSVDVNLNSIKNLEAAKPDGHLIKFNSPKASNMGDASFSFGLAVPAGRRGMEPAISISYSSGGGNGIMGKGFDINYGSSITTDTRFGLPEYDNKEYSGKVEIVYFGDKTINVKPVNYMLDGILLYEKIDERTDTSASYMLQKENRFRKIVHNFDDKNNYWVVTDKNGTKSIYGDNSDACVGKGKEKFTWNITKTVDVHGNYITYDYINDSGYVYPHKILYTGYEGTKEDTGSYSVQFNYDEKPTDTTVEAEEDKDSWPRADVRIDARSKKIVACKKLLTSITTHYKENKPIRTYSFKYKEGLAKEKMLTALSVKNNAGESYEYGFEYNPVEKTEKGLIKYFDKIDIWSNGQAVKTGFSSSEGTSNNSAFGGGLGIGSAVGADFRNTKSFISSSSNGDSYSEDIMIDIDGDGRPDAVRQKDSIVEVAINTGNGFKDFKEISINGSFSSSIDKEKVKTTTSGETNYRGLGTSIVCFSASYGKSETKVEQDTTTTTECSFIDIDRDGLIDIVESYKGTYLKNLGKNLMFEETPFTSTEDFNDVT